MGYQYECVNSFEIPWYDEDEKVTDTYGTVGKGSIWAVSAHRGEQPVRLDLRAGNSDFSYIDISVETLKANFKEVAAVQEERQMDDLISRNKVIEILKETGIITDDDRGHLVVQEIERIPVAYDVEAVCKKLFFEAESVCGSDMVELEGCKRDNQERRYLVMGKPIIRHCQNCQWYENNIFGGQRCSVRYKRVLYERLRAWLCRFYKKVEEKDEE